MSRILASSRHEDAEADAGRLYDTLAGVPGREALYKDVEDSAIGRSSEARGRRSPRRLPGRPRR